MDHETVAPPHASPITRHSSLASLRAEVERIGPIADEPVTLPLAGRELTVARPTNMDDLLDRVAADPEQNLPYWSEIWPSGVALADAILRDPATVRGKRVLELGCGVGITAAAASLAGADLTVTDYAPESLTLCRYNVLANVGREPDRALRLNWRRPDPLLSGLPDRPGREGHGGWPVILAADVLYEARDIEPLLALLARLLAPGGVVWLAEPGRTISAMFLDRARAAGWSGTSTTHPGPWPDPKDAGTTVGLHRLRR